MARYAKPRTVDEALALLAEERWRILAGGTDFYPAQGVRPIRDAVLLNAAAALVAAGVGEGDLVKRVSAGLELANQSVDSGAAADVLARWVSASSS